MSKHTPGPWYAMTGDTGGIVDQANVFSEHETEGEPTFIADTMGVDDEVPLEQRKANALLIAAAPLMLATLEEIIVECESGPSQALRQTIAKKARAAWRAALSSEKREG